MGAPPESSQPSAHSALQTFLSTHPLPQPAPYPASLHHLALQIAFNLCHEHSWSDVRLHFHSASKEPQSRLRRPMLSGMPPRRIYMHPGEQIQLLQKQKDAVKTGAREDAENGKRTGTVPPPPAPEREWVLPSHLRERWSLREFGQAFDSIPAVVEDSVGSDGMIDKKLFDEDEVETLRSNEHKTEVEPLHTWRRRLPKRLLLGTLDDDSTIVFYIVHDGIVKPRQN